MTRDLRPASSSPPGNLVAESGASRRREQADRELGRTTIRPAVARLLSSSLLATLLAVPALEEASRRRAGPPTPMEAPMEAPSEASARPLVGLFKAIPRVTSTAAREGFFAANRLFQAEIDRAETDLEDQSVLRAWLLPPVQAGLLRAAGLGNEQVYPGREGWLFYRSDLDHVSGQGFLEPAVLRARERAGEAWREAPVPDPLPAILALEDWLARRGIGLLVMPTPVKPTVYPERFSRRAGSAAARGVENRSYGDFLARLKSAGVAVFDAAPVLVGAQTELSEPLYLRTDTHWSPAGLELVAATLAARLASTFELGGEGRPYFEQSSTVEGRGDLVSMLKLPQGQELIAGERVEVRSVLEGNGAPWRPRAGSPVLLVGDSFTNVFSDGRLGWGVAAGLAERLAFHLKRPVDRIAVNAGGAHASREALGRAAVTDGERLESTVVVVYQFATRELSFGDWRRVSWPNDPGP